MAKKSNPIEVLNPSRPTPNGRAEIEAFIEQKMAEIMGADKTGIFEPFFQTKAIATEIRKLQTVPHQRKWSNYFRKFGCLVCKRKQKNRPYGALGMCAACYSKTQARLQAVLRSAEEETRPDADSFTPDRLTDLARSAVTRRLSASADTPLRRELQKIVRSKLTGAALREELQKISCELDATDEEIKKGELR